jgi:hypothetical protein
MKIYKFEVPIYDDAVIMMPKGARILSVQVQHGKPVLWALVDHNAPEVKRRFAVRGTGHDIDGLVGEFVGTFQLRDGRLVFHLFDLGE